MSTGRLITDTPTLFPSMLLGRRQDSHWPPFSGGDVHYHFLARNSLFAACRLLGLDGGEVLMPSYHHGVEVEAVAATGARPVFYRVDERWRVDLADLARRIGPDTRALYLIHYAGFPGPVAAMRRLANQHRLVLIEDCALSLLSADGDRPLGCQGDISLFCLYKSLPVPSGGAVRFNFPRHGEMPETRRPSTATTVSLLASSLLLNLEMRSGRVGRALRSGIRALAHGAIRAGQVERVAVGTMHFNPDHAELGAAPLSLAIARRQNFDAIIARRRRNYQILQRGLGELIPPLTTSLAVGVCPLFYPLWAPDKPELLERLGRDGIQAVDFWGTHHPGCDPEAFPETMRCRRHIVEIPCHQDLSVPTMEWIVARVRSALAPVEPSLPGALPSRG